MHLALGSLCMTKITYNLQRPLHKTPFKKKRRGTNHHYNESNDDKKNKNKNEEEEEDVKIDKINKNIPSMPWIHRLSLCDDLEHVKALALEMVHSINPCAFRPSWYMTIEESSHGTNISLKKKDNSVSTGAQNASNSTGISSFEGQFWIGRHPKNGTVRFPTFLKLIDAWQENKMAKLNSDDDDSGSDDDDEEEEEEDGDDDVVVVENKISKESNISNKNEKKDMKNYSEEKEVKDGDGEEEDVGEGKVVDADGEDEDDDADDDKDSKEQKSNRNFHHTPRLYSFSYHKKNIPHHLRACLPSKLLKRIARLGGSAFVPFVIYPKCPISFPSPPFSWIWIHQLKNCQFIESVALQLRILEGHLKLQELPMGILDSKVQVHILFVLYVCCICDNWSVLLFHY